MINCMEDPIDSGHAYAAGGDVYFAVRSFSPLQRPVRQKESITWCRASRIPTPSATSATSALWKAAKPGERRVKRGAAGRPGWHLECSAMSTMYLHTEYDVHGGRIDLIFPHHEKSRPTHAAGDRFARFWLHNAWVTMAGEEMSKSLGNTLSIDALLRRVRGVELRYYLVAPHYRSSIEFSDAALSEAVAAYRRIESFVHRVRERVGAPEPGALCAEFAASMDDDLGTPGALAAVHTTVREGNTALDAGNHEAALGAASAVRAMTAVLGLDPLDPQWARAEGSEAATTALSTLVDDQLAQRQEARARRDFAAADEVRGRLAAAGIVVEDSPDGPTWSLKDA